MRGKIHTVEIEAAPTAVVFQTELAHRVERLRTSWNGRRKWVANERVDAAIRAAYDAWRAHGDHEAMKRAAKELGWPKHAVKKRGRELGMARTKEKNWTVEEVAVLREHAGRGIKATCQALKEAGFTRSRNAVDLKTKRMGFSVRLSDDWYSATRLGRLMGVDQHKVVEWIESGMLPAGKKETDRTAAQGGDPCLISREAVRDFLYAHADEYELSHRIDKWWFLDLLTDGAISN